MDKRMLYNTPSLYYYCVQDENEEEGKPKFVQEIYKTRRYSDSLRKLRVDKGRIDRKGIITVVFNICLWLNFWFIVIYKYTFQNNVRKISP